MKHTARKLMAFMLALALIIPFTPAFRVSAAEFTATLMGQLDADVSDAVDEWGIGDLPEASVVFTIGEEATISMTFPEPIKFTGNWTGISTDIPVADDADAESTGARILAFVVDGNDLGSREVPIIDRDDSGYLTIDIARQWGGDYDAYDLAGMEPFTTLEITFIVPNMPTGGGFIATIMGQLDADVSDAVDEWGIGDLPEASVVFMIGEEATISMTFPEPIKFTGNWTGISTNIPVLGDADAESTNAHITAFVVDGNDLGSREVPIIDRDDSGYLTIDIARQWGGDYDAYDLAGMEPFTTLEITFIVPNMPTGAEAEPEEPPEPVGLATGGNAWIGGTFWDAEEGHFDWIQFQDQSVAFEVGVPFTVGINMGGDTQTHGEASWGYITVVQTDIMDAAFFFDAFIQSITVDGSNIRFEPDHIEVGFDGGVRVSLTNGWSDEPVVAGPHVIGEFSVLEVTLAFVEFGEDDPFDGLPEPAAAAAPEPAPVAAPEPVAPIAAEVPADDDDGGFPIVVVVIIIVVVVAGVVAFLVVKSKKKK